MTAGESLWHLARNPILWVGFFFAAAVFRIGALAPLFHALFPQTHPVLYGRDSFLDLFLSHFLLVAAASLAASALGLGLAVFVTRPLGREFRGIAGALATVGQSFPPAAVLALAVPLVGFGARPTILALALYGFLPVLENAIAGLESVPPAVLEAARGMGLSNAAILQQVELPLAAPAILAGIRISVTIGIGTATIGSTVGAVTLGTPIFDGLVSNNLPFVLEGALIVALFAILTDMLFARLEARAKRHAQ
jgi:osmoprotectant transport system permease protein